MTTPLIRIFCISTFIRPPWQSCPLSEILVYLRLWVLGILECDMLVRLLVRSRWPTSTAFVAEVICWVLSIGTYQHSWNLDNRERCERAAYSFAASFHFSTTIVTTYDIIVIIAWALFIRMVFALRISFNTPISNSHWKRSYSSPMRSSDL